MALSTQLRLIILVVGALLLALIYVLGRRRDGEDNHVVVDDDVGARKPQIFDAATALPIDEDEFDEPSYLRRGGGRRERSDVIAVHQADEESLTLPSVYVDPPVAAETELQSALNKAERPTATTMRVPVLSMQDPDKTVPMKVDTALSESNVEVVNQSISNRSAGDIAADQPVRVTQQKLIALRLAASERIPGEQLLAMFQAESLQHGEFNIFHRLYHGAAVFSVASMIEPGTFDLTTMPSLQYPGITLFMQLPGPLSGAAAFEQMLSCAQRLAQLTSGVVQDEGGVMLLESGIERLHEKVIDLEDSLRA